eukprot:2593550-Prymnesium_polylepis.2
MVELNAHSVCSMHALHVACDAASDTDLRQKPAMQNEHTADPGVEFVLGPQASQLIAPVAGCISSGRHRVHDVAPNEGVKLPDVQ